MRKKKYQPIKMPRRTPTNTPVWFDIINALNKYSVDVRTEWQEKGLRKVSGWVVMTPKGYYLPSTFACSARSAMKKCLEPAMQRFNGLISDLFSEWEKKGYKVVKVKWEAET